MVDVMDKANNRLNVLALQMPGRKSQLRRLHNLIGENDPKNPLETTPCVFVYGRVSTGKTTVVKNLLDCLEYKHAYVNCIECYNQRLIYETILNQLSETKPSPANGYKSYARCDSMAEFVDFMNTIQNATSVHPRETKVLVFDNAEKLLDMGSLVLPSILRLKDLTGLNICVILISQVVWVKFETGMCAMHPIQVHFPDYRMEDMQKILMLDAPGQKYGEEVYSCFISNLLSTFFVICRDLRELRFLAHNNYPKYCEPIESGEATESDSYKLFRKVIPHFKDSLHSLYLRQSGGQLDHAEGGAKNSAALELPFYSKYLLVAAYIASYNPPKTDRKFFLKNAGKLKKRKTHIQSKEKPNYQRLGPKPFVLSRLLSIFFTISPDAIPLTYNLYSQIAGLVTLKYLLQCSKEDLLDEPKYKCAVSLETATTMAKTVGFDLINHLEDFCDV